MTGDRQTASQSQPFVVARGYIFGKDQHFVFQILGIHAKDPGRYQWDTPMKKTHSVM